MKEPKRRKRKILTRDEAHKVAAKAILRMERETGSTFQSIDTVPKDQLDNVIHICSPVMNVEGAIAVECAICGATCYYIDESPGKKVCIKCGCRLMNEENREQNKHYG